MAGDRLYSFQTGQKNAFHVVDYILFAGLLLCSAGIGLFYAIKDRRKSNTKEFLLAGGNMNPIPVSLSLLASFMSAITLLGTPAEMYNYTTIYWWIGLGYFFVILGAAHVYMPVFYRLRVTSSYEVNYMLLNIFGNKIQTKNLSIHIHNLVTIAWTVHSIFMALSSLIMCILITLIGEKERERERGYLDKLYLSLVQTWGSAREMHIYTLKYSIIIIGTNVHVCI